MALMAGGRELSAKSENLYVIFIFGEIYAIFAGGRSRHRHWYIFYGSKFADLETPLFTSAYVVCTGVAPFAGK